MAGNTSGRLSAEERREKTLKSVAEEFAENGFEGTRMADLAEAADISEAMLVKLYESKENLYSELIKQKIEQKPGTPFPDEELDELSPSDVLLTLAMELASRCDEDQTFLRLLYYSALEDNELSDMFYEERIQKLQEQLSSYMRDQIEQGTFRDLDPDQAATGFMGMISHVLCMKHIFQFPLPTGEDIDEDLMKTFVDVFLEGVRAQ
jgi:AcrR family transcriptional regulator